MGCKKRAAEFGRWGWNVLKAVGKSAMRSKLIEYVPQAVGAVNMIDQIAPDFFEQQAAAVGGEATANHMRRKFLLDGGLQLAKAIDHDALDPMRDTDGLGNLTPGNLESALRTALENALFHTRGGLDTAEITADDSSEPMNV